MREELPVRPAPPALVGDAQRLRDAFQSGNDTLMLEIMRGGMLGDLTAALASGTERTLTYAAPQVAALAERVGWLQSSNAAPQPSSSAAD